MASQNFVPEAIMLSFIQLLEKEKYADISVIHLCQKAAVGKASFYRYFNSKSTFWWRSSTPKPAAGWSAPKA